MTLRLNGSTSGYTEIDAPAVAGSNTLTLPTGAGSANQLLKNGSTAGSLAFGTATEDGSGNFAFNSGYGSSAVAYGCRAWVNFNGAGALTGTYSQSGTAITVTVTSHGLSQGQSIYITFQSGTASAEAFTVTSVTSANVFVVTSVTSRTTSGNCTLATIIRGSGNVSSITDNGTGDYTVNFTTAMVDVNYSCVALTGESDLTGNPIKIIGARTYATGTVRLRAIDGTNALVDSTQISVSIFR